MARTIILGLAALAAMAAATIVLAVPAGAQQQGPQPRLLLPPPPEPVAPQPVAPQPVPAKPLPAKPIPAKPPAAQPPPPQPADDRIIEVCNSTKRVLSVATAEPAGERNAEGKDLFISRGWHVLQPSQCRVVFGPGLLNRFYYVYAEGLTGNRSGGTYPFCIRKDAFTIKDVQCDPKFTFANFSQIDTLPSGTRSITYNFRD